MSQGKSQSAEILLKSNGGRIWTGAEQAPWVESVAITGGKVVATGSLEEMTGLLGAETEIIDVEYGKLLIPGIIDAHLHIVMGGESLRTLQLLKVASQADFKQRVKVFADQLGPAEWLLGRGWDQSLWGGELPTSAWLTSLVESRPVWLSRVCGHMGIANREALLLSGIDDSTPNPPGGQIVRDQDGHATGLLKETAMELIKLPPTSEEQLAQDYLAAARHLVALGVTTVHDMWTPIERLSVLRRICNKRALPLRLRVAVPLTELEQLSSFISEHGHGNPMLGWNMCKVFADGSLGARTACMLEEYADAPGEFGLVVTPVEDIKPLALAAVSEGMQVLIHAIGDAAVRGALDVFAGLPRQSASHEIKSGSYRIEHAQHIHPDDVSRFEELGVIASVQAIHLCDDARIVERRLGEERSRWSYPLRALHDSGAVLSAGTDWPIAPASPWLNLHAAVTRNNSGNGCSNVFGPEQCLHLEQALRMSTDGGALASSEAGTLGRLEPGYHADFVLLDRDIFASEPDALLEVKAMATWVGGCQVH